MLKDGETLVGFALCTGGKNAVISHLAIEATKQRKGLGSVLLNKTIHECRSRGAERITLYFKESQSHLQKLYEKAGFTCTFEGSRKEGDEYMTARLSFA